MISTSLAGPGFEVVSRVRGSIERHRMLSGSESVVVAVSGGPDSMCLLDVLARLSSGLDLRLEVAHVDHGLSESSDEVAGRVARAAAEAGFDAHVMRISELEGPNLQARARDLRYGFFDTLAARLGAQRIATGHTLDDRVETTLARLVHGAATEGLAGIPPADGRRIRPLIDLRRQDARAYCLERGLEFFDDPANEDDRFERVAVRRLLVDAVERRWGPGAVRAMASSCARLAEDARALESLAERIYEGVASSSVDVVRLERGALEALPRALRRRVLERAVGRRRDRSGGIEPALDALEAPVGRPVRFAVSGGLEIAVTSEEVIVSATPRPAEP